MVDVRGHKPSKFVVQYEILHHLHADTLKDQRQNLVGRESDVRPTGFRR